jgi:TatD DNase family protein
MQKIDVHTHQRKSGTFIQILNIFAQNLPYSEDEGYFSTGLHPWHIGVVNHDECLFLIELASIQKNMLAVGECGLDRSITIDFVLQELYFRKQIEIAERYSKPLIIHCVRAFPELIKLKKEFKSAIPWIIHGFQGKKETALQLSKHDFYFSIGESLLMNQQKKEILSIIPHDRLFLETDDRETSIKLTYQLASQLLKIDIEVLSGIILENFKRVFGNQNPVNNYLT